MSTDLGLPFGEEQLSSARLDAKTILVGTGGDIADVPNASPIPAALCIEDGEGFLKNHFYIRHFDDTLQQFTGWDDARWKHTHADDTEDEGGDLYDLYVANAASDFKLFRPSLTPEMFTWVDDSGDTGAQVVTEINGTDNTQYMVLETGVTGDTAWAQVQDGGINFSLSHDAEWHCKWVLDTNATNNNLLFRMGVGMERVEDATDNLQKFGIEGCTGDGNNLQLVCADGTSRLKEPTGVVLEQAQAVGSKIEYFVATDVIYYDTLSTEQAASGNYPNSGNVDSERTIRYGVYTENTTEKRLAIWGDALYGKILDGAWI